MSEIVLGVGDLGASSKPGSILKTFALGSCVAVLLMDTESHTTGMVHIALPHSKLSSEKAQMLPGYFADSGISALIKLMIRKGFKGNYKKLIVKMAGGSNIMDTNDVFQIGSRNVSVIRKILKKGRMNIVAEDVGGSISRTVFVYVDSFRVVLSSPGKPKWEL